MKEQRRVKKIDVREEDAENVQQQQTTMNHDAENDDNAKFGKKVQKKSKCPRASILKMLELDS